MKITKLFLPVIFWLSACSVTQQSGQGQHFSEAGLLLCEDMGEGQCEVHELINLERTSRGLDALSPSEPCYQAAQAHAKDMDTNNYFSHDGPGESWSERMTRFEVHGLKAENIATGSQPSTVVEMWMNSSGHRNNILNPKLKYSGVGLSGKKWVQCFSANL